MAEHYISDYVVYKPKKKCEECKKFDATKEGLCDVCIYGYNHITIIYLINMKYKKYP